MFAKVFSKTGRSKVRELYARRFSAQTTQTKAVVRACTSWYAVRPMQM